MARFLARTFRHLVVKRKEGMFLEAYVGKRNFCLQNSSSVGRTYLLLCVSNTARIEVYPFSKCYSQRLKAE